MDFLVNSCRSNNHYTFIISNEKEVYSFNLDSRQEIDQTNTTLETTTTLPEKTKRGSPTNKSISIRNIKAQIINMSANENAGFKNEYYVRNKCSNLILFVLLLPRIESHYHCNC